MLQSVLLLSIRSFFCYDNSFHVYVSNIFHCVGISNCFLGFNTVTSKYAALYSFLFKENIFKNISLQLVIFTFSKMLYKVCLY